MIFVVDSNDRERVSEAREELHRLLTSDTLKDAIFLVFANKQDLPDAMNASQLVDNLELTAVTSHKWYCQVCKL